MKDAKPESPYMRQRRALLDAVGDALLDDPSCEGRIVSGFAIVVELTGLDGERGIVARSSDATGETDLTPWAAAGLVGYALDDGMFDVDEADDEDE